MTHYLLNYCKYDARLRIIVHNISSTQRENSLKAVDGIRNYIFVQYKYTRLHLLKTTCMVL